MRDCRPDYYDENGRPKFTQRRVKMINRVKLVGNTTKLQFDTADPNPEELVRKVIMALNDLGIMFDGMLKVVGYKRGVDESINKTLDERVGQLERRVQELGWDVKRLDGEEGDWMHQEDNDNEF